MSPQHRQAWDAAVALIRSLPQSEQMRLLAAELNDAMTPVLTIAAMHDAGVACNCGRPQCPVAPLLEAAHRFHVIGMAVSDGKAPPREVGLGDVLAKIGGGG